MLFYHKITCIFMIYVCLSQKFVVAIYAVFPPIFLAGKVDSANVFTFRMYVPRVSCASGNVFYLWWICIDICGELVLICVVNLYLNCYWPLWCKVWRFKGWPIWAAFRCAIRFVGGRSRTASINLLIADQISQISNQISSNLQ